MHLVILLSIVFIVQKRTSLSLIKTAEVDDRVMSPEEVGEKAGERIRDFCADYATHWMDLEDGLPRRMTRSAAYTSVAGWYFRHTFFLCLAFMFLPASYYIV